MDSVAGTLVSAAESSKLIRFFSLAGLQSSVSGHWIASFIVSESSWGFFPNRV